MGYLAAGSIDSSHYNTTKYPGIAKPMDQATLALFKELQAQANRCASVMGFKKVTVDGDLGMQTLGLLGHIAGKLGAPGSSDDPAREVLILADLSSVGAIAGAADTLAGACQAVADQMGVSASVSMTTSAGSVLTAGGQTVRGTAPPPPAAAASLFDLGSLDTTTLVIAGLGLGAAVYFLDKSHKKRRGRARTRVTRRYR